MRRGEHRPRSIEPSGGEVQQVGRREPEVHDIDTLAAHPFGECRRELDAGLAHVVRDQDARRSRETSERRPDRAGDAGIELLGNGAPDVVGLEDHVERHAAPY